MKHKTFISLIALLLLASISFIGCNDNGGGGSSQGTQALTENDFAEDSALRADLNGGVIVTFLESPESEEAENDTGTLGVDEVPVTNRKTSEQTFCWEDDDPDAMHFMELRDSEGSLILAVEANGDCVEEVIEEGNYVMSIHHDGSVEDSLPIFLIPNPEELEQARETEGIIDRVNVAAANILKAIHKTVTKDAKAQELPPNIMYLLVTNSCVGCNLERARLFRANLSDANLSDANLSRANLEEAILRRAKLIGAKLIGANLFRADLNSADLTGATWCDGTCVCASGSFSQCKGCPSVDICTGS